MVPKQENEGDDVAPPAEDPPPTTTAEPPATHVSRQRLDSLADPSSRSASPSVRGRGRGKKPGPAVPVFTGRRSKAERDQRTAEALSREQERNKDREKEAARQEKKRQFEESRRTNSTRGRGGFSGTISGPFSDPTQRAKEKTPHQGGFGGGGGFGGNGTGSRSTTFKGESGSGGGSSWSTSGPSVKREDGGYVSSDDEDGEEAAFPRMDVDTIQISSDEDDAAMGDKREKMTVPVRIRRKDHKERVVGINTEASSEAAAKIRQKAEETGSVPTGVVPERTVNKGKGKTKDLEITGERKQYKGVWQESEDSDVKVKTEPTSEDEEMLDAEQVGIGAEKQAETLPESDRKLKPHAKEEPEFQTDEERAEWARYQFNLVALREELGPNNNTPTMDESGDVSMANADKTSLRDGRVYLFQLPPIMPDLIAPGIKKEASDVTVDAPDSVPTATGPAAISLKAEGKKAVGGPGAVPIKKEEDFSNPLADIPEHARFTSGYVGKLRVHKSGRTTLDWGGTSYELTPGKRANFVQEVVSIHVHPDADQEPEADAGEAISFGSVKGKFVVTPDFGQLLG